MAVVFLLLGAGDLFGVHPCPHHEGGAGHEEAQGHSAPSEHAHHGTPDTEAPAEHGGCTCQGACPTASAGFLPIAPRVEIGIPVEFLPLAVVRGQTSYLPRYLPFFLPYSQAPPIG